MYVFSISCNYVFYLSLVFLYSLVSLDTLHSSFFFSMCLGFVINWSASWTIEMNDPLTLAVAGSTKSAVMGLVVCAGLFDPSYIFTLVNFIGLQISAVASLCYVYSVHNKSNKPTISTAKTGPEAQTETV